MDGEEKKDASKEDLEQDGGKFFYFYVHVLEHSCITFIT